MEPELRFLQEFVDVSPAHRNWKGIAISLLVIVAVCSLITLSVVVLAPAGSPSSSESMMTAEDLFKPEFSVHNPEATWISDSEVVYRNRDGDVIKFNFILNQTEIILSNSTFLTFKAVKYFLSPDQKFILFAYDVTQLYRYSFMASYIVYNIYTREVWELNPPEVHQAVLQHASWGRGGNQLIYIFENNIYYQSDMRSNALRITSSGVGGVIFNGLTDWLYEEEILHTHLAHWWSPDGHKLAFLTINDTLVPNMVLPRFTGGTYPRGQRYPYPVAGRVNPVVMLLVVNLSGPTHTEELQPPDQLRHRDFYITMVTWISTTHLAVRWLNRAQNASLLTVCDVTVGVCRQRHEESSARWISRQGEEPLFSRDGRSFFITLPVRHFNHVTMITTQNDHDDVQHLTSGDWEVTRILAFNEEHHIVYFLSTEDSAHHRHLYSVSKISPFPRRCLTCGLRDKCLFYDADVSPDAQHVVLHCKGPGVPAVLLLSLHDVDSCFMLEDNVLLRSSLENKKAVQSEVRTITKDDFELQMKLLYPPDFSDSFVYGLLLIVCSSPGDQQVTEEFRHEWDWVLLGSGRIIVARVDGRGSGFRGQRVLQQIHGGLGTVDTEDHVAALEFLLKLPFIDRTRVGVFGQDYGGFVTLMMMKSSQLIRCGAVQSPVTDWSMYASAFSERFLGPPSTNNDKYQTSRVLSDLSGLRGRTVFVAHGTADANVPFQHSAELIKAFIQMGVDHFLQIFPDESHFLSSRSRSQLTHSLIGYFKGCLLASSSFDLQQQDKE